MEDDTYLDDLNIPESKDETGINDPTYGGVDVQDRYGDLLKDLTNFDSYIQSLMQKLLALKWDDKKGEYIPQKNSKPLVSYEGGRKISIFLSNYTRNNNMLVHLDKTVSRHVQQDILDFTHFTVWAKMEEFGIKTNTDAEIVVRQIEHAAKFILESCWGNKTPTDFMANSTSFNQSTTVTPQQQPQQQQKQQGAWGNFKDKLIGR